MKRKALAGMMSLALMVAVAVPVHAAEDKTTELNTSVPSTYELTIPAATTIDFNKLSTDLKEPLKVTGNVKPNETVTVTATSTNKLENQNNAGAAIDFALKQGATDFTSATWNETELRDGTKAIPLSVAIEQSAWDSAKAGDYTGSIVFTAELK